MKLRLALAGLVIAALNPSTAFARDQLGQRDAVVMDSQRGYIFFRTPVRLDVRFMREVDAAEQATWDAERERAFQRARERNRRQIANWDRESPNCRGAAAVTPQCEALGSRPELVTNENFAFTPPEADNFIDVTRGREFERTESGFTYLRAVEPGTYVLYGPILATPQAVAGVCLCMGSVRFEVRAGQIVDIGELRLQPEAGSGPNNGRFGPEGRLPSPSVMPAMAGAVLPQRLAGLPVVAANLRSADPMPNYFGILIDRLAPVSGVLAYDRDRVLDLKAQASATPSPGTE